MARRQKPCPACGGAGINIGDGRTCWQCQGVCAVWVDEPDQPAHRGGSTPSPRRGRPASSAGGFLAGAFKVFVVIFIVGGILEFMDDDEPATSSGPAPVSQLQQPQSATAPIVPPQPAPSIAFDESQPLRNLMCRLEHRQAKYEQIVAAARQGGPIARQITGSVAEQREAVQMLFREANQGNAEAANNLGVLYCYSLAGVEHSPALAAHWLGVAAQHGHEVAPMLLVALYAYGAEGVPQDHAAAQAILTLEAEKGRPEAHWAIGHGYVYGDLGYPKDDLQALPWLQRAANQGVAQAQYELARIHGSGRAGLPVDTQVAADWSRRAAAQGYQPAQEYLSRLVPQ